MTLTLPKTTERASADRITPVITVIVPVRNEERFLAGTLEALLAQDYPASAYEVLVVDGQSTDGTVDIATQYARRDRRFRCFANSKRWSSAARNLALRAAQGDLLLLVDGHCQLDDTGYLAAVADAFERSGADCLGRPQPQQITVATPWQQAVAVARASWLGHHPDSHIYTQRDRFVPASSVAVAYRREVLERLGGFDEAFDACEDVELNTRIDAAGGRCYFEPRLALPYHPRSTPSGLWKQLIRYGRGRARLARKHPGTLSIGTLVPSLFVTGLLLGPAVCLQVPALWTVYGSALAAYVVLIAMTTITSATQTKHNWRAAVLLPFVFPTVHLAAGSGFLWELLSWTRRNPWRPTSSWSSR